MQKKIIIIILIILVILILISIGLIYSIKKSSNDYIILEESSVGHHNPKTSKNIEKVTDMHEYYTILTCMQEYLESIYTNEIKIDPDEIDLDEPTQKTELEIKEKIYNLLSDTYIKKNQITVDNVLSHVETIKSTPELKVEKMLAFYKEAIENYIVCGKVNNSQLKYYIVTIDKEYNTYAVEPVLQQDNDINKIEEIIIKNSIKNIAKNQDNKLVYSDLNEQTMCMYYLMNYKSLLKNDIETAYEILNENYKAKRFPKIEYFKEYLIDNKDTIDKISLDSYLIEEKDGYIKYTCQDKLGNIYEFQATAVMEYTAKLDSYTDSILFEEQYNQSNESKKAMANVEKIIKMIESKDYRTIYEELDSNFKQNYFKTYESMKEYIKNNFFEYNTVKYENIEKSGQYYICKTTITDETGKDSKQISKTFIIKLLEGTDFVFSFNVE